MKKYFLLLILLINGLLSAQSLKIAVLSDIAALKTNPSLTADSLRRIVSSFGDVNRMITIGNITANGSLAGFTDAKSFLDSVGISYKVLPGKNEFTQHVSGILNTRRFFDEENFIFESDNMVFIGLQTVDFSDNTRSHISKETFDWLKASLINIRNRKVFLFLNSPIDKIDNFAKLSPYFKTNSTVGIFTPDFAVKKEKKTALRKTKTVKKQSETPFLHCFEIRNDSIFTYAYTNEDGFTNTNSGALEEVDLAQLAGVSPDKGITLPVLNLDSKSSTIAKILHYKDKFYIATMDGRITCYNSDFTVKWEYRLTGGIAAAPVIAEDHLIAASVKGDIVILDPMTKAEILSIGIDCEIVSPLTIIDFKGTKELLIPKSTTSTKALVFSGVSGEIFCYDLETLQELWVNSDSKYPVVQNIIDSGNKLFFKTSEGKIICIDTRSGQLIWRWGYKDVLADTGTGLFFNGKQIITLTNNNSITGIDFLLGIPDWQTEDSFIKDIYVAPDDLATITALSENKLCFYNSKKGNLLRDIKLKEKRISLFLKQDNLIGRPFLLSGDNILYSLEKSKSLQAIGFIGNTSIVSFGTDSDNGLYLLNLDGQLIRITDN